MNNSIIIAELERRKKGAEGENLASRLCVLAEKVVNVAVEHQKRVAQVMNEFRNDALKEIFKRLTS